MKKVLDKLKGKQAPRDLKTIKAELSQVTFELGNAEYNLYAYTKEKERLSKRSMELNLEGKERQDLDAAIVAETQQAPQQGETK